MNVYDFDNTIYDGESSFDFFLFCSRKNKKVLKYILPVINVMLKYKMCRITTDELIAKGEQYMSAFLSCLDNPKEIIKEFWDKHENKIKDFYRNIKQPDDVIISASCDVLLEEICLRLGIKNLLASSIDTENCKVKYLCYRDNKVKLFKEFFPDAVIDNFYSDSLNDLPMMSLAKRAFLVKGNKIKEYTKKLNAH